MNKVFKVIWSEARNCYVVVSEMAKNCSKSCSTKKLLAMLLATGVMTCVGFGVAEAKLDIHRDIKIKYQKISDQTTGLNTSELWHYENGKHYHGPGGEGTPGAISCGEEVRNSDLTIGALNKAFADLSANDVLIYKKSINGGKIENGKITLNTIGGEHIQLDGEITGGWKLSTNSAAVTTEVDAGDTVDFSGDENIRVSNEGKNVKVALNSSLTGITSITNYSSALELSENQVALTDGSARLLLRDNAMHLGYQAGQTYAPIQIKGVADGTEINDAVNFGQLKAVETLADKHTTLEAGTNISIDPGETETGALHYVISADDTYVVGGTYNAKNKQLTLTRNDQETVNIDLSGIQGGAWKLSTNKDTAKVADVAPGDTVDLSPAYDANGHNNIIISTDPNNPKNVQFHVNGNLQGITHIENQGAAIDLDGSGKSVKIIAGGGVGIIMGGGKMNINNVIDIDTQGKISGVADGIKAHDAVNLGQLQSAISGLNLTKVEAGTNVAVSEVKDPETGKITAYKVNADATSVSGEGNITVTPGAKDANNVTNYEVTLNKDLDGIETISNNDKKIDLGGDNLLLQNGDAVVSIDAQGHIGGVAAAVTDDQAVNLGQLKEYTAGMDTHVKAGEYTVTENKVTMDIVDKEGKSTGDQVVIKDVASKTELDDVKTLAQKHNTVAGGANITVTDKPNEGGGKEYTVALNDNINLERVTTGKTMMDDEGVRIGRETSLTADALKIDSKTYIDEHGINANEQKITNVADAELSETSMDAVNGSQLHATNQKVMENSNRISRLGDRVNKVGAGAAALAALHPMDFDPDDKWSFAAGYGNYAGQNAAAIGAYYRPDEKVMFSVGGTVGNGENMVNAGISFALDRTNRVSNSRTAMAREIVDLRGQLVEMGAKVAKMEAMFGMLDESKTMLFPDIPENHWAYEYVAKLAGNGILEGYPDGNFSGDRMMTRYEFAAMLYRAIEKGQALEARVLKEFAPELGRIRVERIHGENNDKNKVERVRVNSGKTYGMRDNYGSKIR